MNERIINENLEKIVNRLNSKEKEVRNIIIQHECVSELDAEEYSVENVNEENSRIIEEIYKTFCDSELSPYSREDLEYDLFRNGADNSISVHIKLTDKTVSRIKELAQSKGIKCNF